MIKILVIGFGVTFLVASVVVVQPPRCPGQEESWAPVSGHYEFQGCIK